MSLVEPESADGEEGECVVQRQYGHARHCGAHARAHAHRGHCIRDY